MDIFDVTAQLNDIKAIANDFEGAHDAEDTLYKDVLRAIADGADDAPAIAREALKAQNIPFDRYYA